MALGAQWAPKPSAGGRRRGQTSSFTKKKRKESLEIVSSIFKLDKISVYIYILYFQIGSHNAFLNIYINIQYGGNYISLYVNVKQAHMQSYKTGPLI